MWIYVKDVDGQNGGGSGGTGTSGWGNCYTALEVTLGTITRDYSNWTITIPCNWHVQGYGCYVQAWVNGTQVANYHAGYNQQGSYENSGTLNVTVSFSDIGDKSGSISLRTYNQVATAWQGTNYYSSISWSSPGPNITVNFDAQGGTVSPASKTVKHNGLYGDLPIPVLSGKAFVSWYTLPNGGGSPIFRSSTVQALDPQDNTPEDITLYALYTGDQSTITMTYNNSTQTFSNLPNPLPIYYNNNVLATLTNVNDSTTLNCNNKLMSTHITFGDKKAICGGKKMASNVVFTLTAIAYDKVTVTLYGYSSSSIVVDRGTSNAVTHSLNSNGIKTGVELTPGPHDFYDSKTGVTKTFTIVSTTTEVACGVYYGGTGTKNLPFGEYTHIRGTRYGTVSQAGRSGSTQQIWPACRRTQSVTCSGAISATLASGNIATLNYQSAWQTSRTSGEKTSAFDTAVTTFNGGSLTISTSGSQSQDSGNSAVNVSGSGGVRYVYVY